MISDVSSNLHTFFVPQMEQLGMKEQPSRHGSLSMRDDEFGRGLLWAHSIGDNCLYTFHEFSINEQTRLVEFPDDYVCVTSMTDCSARLCPVQSRYLRERNILSFRQKGGAVSFDLMPNEYHRSYTLCMTPNFFDELPGLTDSERETLVSYLCSCDTNTHSREIGDALESMGHSWAMSAGGACFCEGRMKEIVARLLDDAVKASNDDPREPSTEEKRLAREAQMMIDARYAENITLQSIANELFVGRTRLCEVFREQMGLCVAEYLRDVRMDEARKLLETTDLKAAEISRLVGYAHQSSFTDAFRRQFGITPSQWRDNDVQSKVASS